VVQALTRFIKLAGEINSIMPEWVVSKALKALEHQGKKLQGAKGLILGVAYKKNMYDLCEASAFRLVEFLFERKMQMDYHDSYVPQLSKTRHFDFQMSSV